MRITENASSGKRAIKRDAKEFPVSLSPSTLSENEDRLWQIWRVIEEISVYSVWLKCKLGGSQIWRSIIIVIITRRLRLVGGIIYLFLGRLRGLGGLGPYWNGVWASFAFCCWARCFTFEFYFLFFIFGTFIQFYIGLLNVLHFILLINLYFNILDPDVYLVFMEYRFYFILFYLFYNFCNVSI